MEYAKPLRPGDQSLAPLDYHIRYGPYCWKSDGVPLWIVPIQPNYHKTLFPDADDQMQLIAGGRASGNSIRKAYLSRSGIRSLSPGDVLLFYRSDDRRAITAVAVAEETLVSNSPEELARFVGKRTVYRFQDIQAWCDGGSAPVLAILFRYAYPLATPIPFARLKEHGALVAAPQSTLQVKREALQWLQTQLSAP